MEGEVEVDLIIYLTKRSVKRVKVPLSGLKPDDEGHYSYGEIEGAAYQKVREEFKVDGFTTELSESELISYPEGFNYWI